MAEDDEAPDDAQTAAEWEAMMAAEDSAAGDGACAVGGDGASAVGGDGGDEDVAAEWAAMVDEDEGTLGGAGNSRVLNQDEIDSLLGFDSDDDDGGDRTGIQAIINSALVSYERLPMLEVVFDRLIRMMSTSLRNFTADNVEVSLDNITSIRFGDYLNSIPLPAMLSVFRAEQWDNYGLLTEQTTRDRGHLKYLGSPSSLFLRAKSRLPFRRSGCWLL